MMTASTDAQPFYSISSIAHTHMLNKADVVPFCQHSTCLEFDTSVQTKTSGVTSKGPHTGISMSGSSPFTAQIPEGIGYSASSPRTHVNFFFLIV
jgi:hypothetical protein